MTLSATRLPHDAGTRVINAGVRYSWGGHSEGFMVWHNERPNDPVATFDALSRFEAWKRFRHLEAEAEAQHGRRIFSSDARWRRRLVYIGLPTLVVGLLVAVLVIRSEWSDEGAGRENGGSVDPAFASVADDHRVRLPPGWTTTQRSEITELHSPEGSVSVSITTAPEGTIAEIARAGFQTLTEAWTDVRIGSAKEQRIGEATAISVDGTATDDSGEPVRFMSIALELDARSFSVSVLALRGWTSSRKREVNEIVASLSHESPSA